MAARAESPGETFGRPTLPKNSHHPTSMRTKTLISEQRLIPAVLGTWHDMTFLVKGRKQRAVFKRRAMPSAAVTSSTSSTSSSASRDLDLRGGFVIEEILQEDDETNTIHNTVDRPAVMSTMAIPASAIPGLFRFPPPLVDQLVTETSERQEETIQECLPFLSALETGLKYNDRGVAHLDRERHIKFLHKSLNRLPAPYVAADASRPWMFYWALAGLSALGEDISGYRERIISTVRPIQNSAGGFGGGNGQMSHLAPTYCIVLCLAMVGGQEALDLVDRKAMWKWLGALKQADGGFQMALGGEEDVRGAYCAAVIISLLNLPLDLPKTSPGRSRDGDTLLTGLPEWVAKCQTYEGGISGRPDAEAHGAYAFCALACLCVLGEPRNMIPKYLDVPRLIAWLSARQYAPEAGFSGRTNKLVDGCYSHWVGGCWPLIEACLDGSSPPASSAGLSLASWRSVGKLYSQEGLIRYILCCCQDTSKRGGLRDKPSHSPDSYHTCYVLAGLSSAQHKWTFDPTSALAEASGPLSSAYHWSSEPIVEEDQIFREDDRVGTLHPVFVIPEGAGERARQYFVSKGGF